MVCLCSIKVSYLLKQKEHLLIKADPCYKEDKERQCRCVKCLRGMLPDIELLEIIEDRLEKHRLHTIFKQLDIWKNGLPAMPFFSNYH